MEGNRHLGLLILILICTLQDSVAIDAPAIVTLENEGNIDSLKVTWTPPNGATDHLVTWSQPDGSGNGTSPDLSGTATEYVISGLTPGTLYNVTVTAQNGTDDTNDDSGQGRTKPSPVNLSESGATNESISAEWTKPSGAIDQYTFTCSNGTEDPSSPIAENNSAMYMASCVGLSTPGADYTITLTSRSGNEISNESTISITALPNPVELTESDSTLNSVNATWVKPAGEVTSYDVQCSGGDVVPPSDQTGDGPFSASCTGLTTPGEEYTMNVTSLSNGQRSDVATIPLRALPSQITDLEEAGATNDSVSATWTKPGGVVSSYNVTCPDGSTRTVENDDGSARTVTCSGLPAPGPGGNHTITVVTLSDNKASDPATVTITALPNPVELTEGNSTVNSVSTTWVKPAGEVTSYDVQCSGGDVVPPSDQTGDGPFSASCTDLPTPGDEYTMNVTSLSNGQRSDVATIALRALPSVVSISAVGSNNTAISATWTIPDSVVDTFNIMCSNGTASPASIPVESSPTSDTFTAYCIGLPTPGLEYNLSVVAISNEKLSAVRTVGVHASPAGVDLTEGSPTTTSVSVNWMQPESAVDSYNISCSRGDASPATIQNTSQTFYMASCVNLPVPGDMYTMTVDSIVDNGATTTSSSIVLFALPEVVTLNEMIDMVTTTTITASWINATGEFDYYEVSCSNGTASPAQVNPSDNLIASCTGLTPGGNYTISVTTVSSDKRSETDIITITAYPNTVVLREGGITTRQITVQWDDPEGEEASFNVDCGADGSNDITLLPNDAMNDNFQATCNASMAGAPYDITVTSVSGDKESPITGTFTAATPDGVTFGESSLSTTSITVTWNALAGADGFRVNCSEGAPTPNSSLPGSATQVTCDGVTPGGNHSVSVVTQENNGESPATVVYVVAVPLSVDLTPGVSTTSSVTATWDIPGGIVDEFEVECSNGTASTPNTGSDQDYFALCEDVDTPGDNYTMTVTSLSNTQRNSATIVLTALPEAVTLNEMSDMVNTTSITASWTMPNGIVEYYQVSCSDGTASPDKVYPSDNSDNLVASCTGLSTPGDNYNISVMSVSSGQGSAASAITITALPEAVELSEGESNATAISATWRVPNGVVDTFTITCSNGTASPTSIQGEQPLKAYCVGLPQSGEEYILSVVAISNDKMSAISTIKVFALPLGVDLEEGPSTLTSVNASWMRQEDSVDSYSIMCSQGDAFPSTIEDTDQVSFSAACVNLTGPGATYSMTVFSEVGTGSSSNSTRASSLIQLVAVPASVESIAITEPTTTTVDVQWDLMQCSDCIYNYFLLTFEPDSQEPIRVNYTNGVNEYSSQVSGLIQGRSYSFTVVSVSGVGVQDATLKTSEENSVDQRTVPATPSGVTILSGQRQLNLVWAYAGDADNFNITVTPNHGRTVFNGNFTDPAAEITGLTPGTTYDIAIVTVSGDERSEPITETARTDPDKPSPVRNPRAEAVDKNTITLTYESPLEPNGDITGYMISYNGTRNDNPSHEFSDGSRTVLTVTYNDLYPGFSYTFTIIAVNDGEFESDPASTEPVETPQEEPPPVEEDYPYDDNTVISDTSTTSFTVELPEDLFSQDNGELLTFAVIITRIANDPTVGTTELNYDEARAQNAYITAIDIPYPYSPSFGSNRKRRATEPSATVVIGDGTCAGSPKEYCNRALDDNTQYYYAFRAYNDMGDETSGTFGPVKTVKDNTAGIAAGVSVSLIIIIVAVVLAVVFIKRRQREQSPRPSLDGCDNPTFNGPDHEMRPTTGLKTRSSMHRKSHSKPIVLNKFEGHYNRMKADSDFRFTEEYDEIRQVGKDQAIVAATDMVNRAKNRFTNILPYEHSRVKLAALADDPGTDYINANYIPGHNSPREFMACQGPLPGTVDDMWRMIWEKKTSIIVMLTQLVEKGKIKCHEYWPADYNPVTYGSIQVQVQALQQYDHWVIREFSLAQGEEIRKLTQYHFMSWPDHGVPDKTWTMLDFVRMVREAIQKEASDRPIVAHCSAGVGRTGTYVALDRLMQAMQENDYIDIFGIICEMRMQRNHMVQTEKQYIFIHECVMDLLRRGEEDTGESIYVNMGANGYKDQDDVNKNLLDQAV